jgi:hypothetical protein
MQGMATFLVTDFIEFEGITKRIHLDHMAATNELPRSEKKRIFRPMPPCLIVGFTCNTRNDITK